MRSTSHPTSLMEYSSGDKRNADEKSRVTATEVGRSFRYQAASPLLRVNMYYLGSSPFSNEAGPDVVSHFAGLIALIIAALHHRRKWGLNQL